MTQGQRKPLDGRTLATPGINECLVQCFFLSRGTFETVLNFCRNLDTENSTKMRILVEPCKELAEPVGSAEPRLKNTGLVYGLVLSLLFIVSLSLSTVVRSYAIYVCGCMFGQAHVSTISQNNARLAFTDNVKGFHQFTIVLLTPHCQFFCPKLYMQILTVLTKKCQAAINTFLQNISL